MKIIQICNFSSGISGVWTRVLEDSINFIKEGHEVHVFSSDETEEGIKVGPELNNETLDSGIKITRFPIKKKIGYALWFDFENECIDLDPDIIICHGLRKPYLGKALKIAKRISAKCFLITHAPFIDKDLRDKKTNLYIWAYDKFIGKNILNSFDKVLAICKWEIPLLERLGCNSDNVEYLPNSLSNEFFIDKQVPKEKKILYLGRMNPIKEIEVLIKAFKKSKGLKDYKLEIVSSQEGDYFKSLQQYKDSNIIFTRPIYDLDEKIKKIDSCEIFVLPSRKESLPFGVIESMSRGKIVIATNTKGGEEMIDDSENGFLFDIGDDYELKLLLEKISTMDELDKDKIRFAAKSKSEEYNISKLMCQWRGLFNG